MSITIDWSKAPEEATHYGPTGRLHAAWYKKVDGRWMYWAIDIINKWHYIDGLPPNAIARPTEWNGKGLPPVGTVCEWNHTANAWWHTAKIHYIGSVYVIVSSNDGEQHYYLRDISFRPIRTPEQIAAEEREKAVDEMVTVWKRTMGRFAQEERGLAEMLYDAGYRSKTND